MSDSDMAKRIRELRLARNMTLEQVGEIVGVGKSTVRKWETGMIANMKRDKIAALAEALKTTPAYLMGWEEEPTPTIPVSTSSLPEEIQKQYGKETSHAFSLYLRLDDIDRGKITERMETFLEDKKYKKPISKNA